MENDNGQKTRQMRRAEVEAMAKQCHAILLEPHTLKGPNGEMVPQVPLIYRTARIDDVLTKLVDVLEMKGFIRREEIGLPPKDEPRIVPARPGVKLT